MAEETISIQCRVSKQEKKNWKLFSNTQKFPSLSELIRYAVNNTINNDIKREDNWFYLKNDKSTSRNKYVRARISKDEKERWMQFIKKNSFPSISELIRFSVFNLIEAQMQDGLKARSNLYFIYKNERFFQDEVNKLLTIPSCIKCGQTGVAWLSNDGLCINCHNKKQIEEYTKKTKDKVKNIALELPEELIKKIQDELKVNNILAYRTFTEFIIDATRRRLEEVQTLRLKANP